MTDKVSIKGEQKGKKRDNMIKEMTTLQNIKDFTKQNVMITRFLNMCYSEKHI